MMPACVDTEGNSLCDAAHAASHAADSRFRKSVDYWCHADKCMIGPRSADEMRVYLCRLFAVETVASVKTPILDFGCGVGRIYDAVGRPQHYVGMDISRKYIMAFRSEFGGSVMLMLLKDRAYIPFYDDSFSTVIAFSVLTHIDQSEHYDYLGEFRRVLTIGGHLAVSLFDASKYGGGRGNWLTADIGEFKSSALAVGLELCNTISVAELGNVNQTFMLFRRVL